MTPQKKYRFAELAKENFANWQFELLEARGKAAIGISIEDRKGNIMMFAPTHPSYLFKDVNVARSMHKILGESKTAFKDLLEENAEWGLCEQVKGPESVIDGS